MQSAEIFTQHAKHYNLVCYYLNAAYFKKSAEIFISMLSIKILSTAI